MNVIRTTIHHAMVTWRHATRNKTAITASVLSGGEALVEYGGVDLPYSDRIDARWRLLVIFALVGAAYYFRWKAQRESTKGERHGR